RGVGGTGAGTLDGGRTVLQYSAHRSTGSDIRQQPGWVRTLVVVLALAVAAGAAYAAFTLTRTARSQASALSE
ncbi:MAG: hypothetical protein AAF957_18155, partial [Planctomycetota bacterium]